jgi:hypothetical protein
MTIKDANRLWHRMTVGKRAIILAHFGHEISHTPTDKEKRAYLEGYASHLLAEFISLKPYINH